MLKEGVERSCGAHRPGARARNAGGLGAALLALAMALLPSAGVAQTGSQEASPIKSRNLAAQRAGATQRPRSEGDQAIVDGWPLYRTERGQEAFNDAMATLRATEGPAPAAEAFKGCQALACNLSLPMARMDGWLAPGRYWVAPDEYVVIAQSPRAKSGRAYRRHASRRMRYFVFHEFHNSSRNIDPYDTISSHRGSVFVPFYMSRQAVDAKGRRYVVVLQVAPLDVVSVHATNRGSSGPGIEVAKNASDATEPLQNLAGILVASMVKAAAPQLQVVNHRGNEGLPMLQAYDRRMAALRGRANAPTVALPYVAALPDRVAAATGRLSDLVLKRGASPPIPIAERGIVPPRASLAAAAGPAPGRAATASAAAPAGATAAASPVLSPLAAYLRANLTTMLQHPDFAPMLPAGVAAIGEESPDSGVVFLVDATQHILGRIEPLRERGAAVSGRYVYVSLDREAETETTFALDLARPVSVRSAASARNRATPR